MGFEDDLKRQEATLAALEAAPAARLLVPLYLVGAAWSWFLICAMIAFAVWRFLGATLAGLAALALALAGVAAYGARFVLDRKFGP